MSSVLTEPKLKDELTPEERRYRRKVFNMRAVNIWFKRLPPKQHWAAADYIFKNIIEKQPEYTNHSKDKKFHFWRKLYWAIMRANIRNGVVNWHFNKSSNYCSAHEQVMRIAAKLEYIKLVVSKPYYDPTGESKIECSKLVPLIKLTAGMPIDPDSVEKRATRYCVRMKKRVYKRVQYQDKNDKWRWKTEESKVAARVDRNHPVAIERNRIAAAANSRISTYKIFYKTRDMEGNNIIKQLRPALFCSFLDNFSFGGRFNSDGCSHLSITRKERNTIWFEQGDYYSPNTELDLSGCFIRLLYHLQGIDYQGEPYKLWGPNTTNAQKFISKIIGNILINEKNLGRAAFSYKWLKNLKTKSGKKKGDGRQSLEKAKALRRAIKETGLEFREVAQMFLEQHKPVAHLFGSKDIAVKLQNYESNLAANVLDRVEQELQIIILPIHDGWSFPHEYSDKVQHIIDDEYYKLIGVLPVIGGAAKTPNVEKFCIK